MEGLVVLFFVGGIFLFGVITGSVTTHPSIELKKIERAVEICQGANSKISKISDTTVICANGGEFKYEPKN